MKRRDFLLALGALSLMPGEVWAFDMLKGVKAGLTATKGLTLSDNEVRSLSLQAVQGMDSKNTIAPANDPYAKRLEKLTRNVRVSGITPNFKVYLTKSINAFATGDGSIRVFSGLMDAMDDPQLMAVIGHEIGHVMHGDVKRAMRNAYMITAGRTAVSAAGGTVGMLAESQVGELSQAFVQAQFSQKQEYAADDYALSFCMNNGIDPYAMSNALQTLVKLSGGKQASAVAQMFSSHPDSAKRAVRMKEQADKVSRKG